MVCINKGQHDDPHELPSGTLEGLPQSDQVIYTHDIIESKPSAEVEKLEYIYQHFQNCEKIHEMDSEFTCW